MADRAEERAKKYCEGSSFEDACMEKPAYIAGYKQAEKDLATYSWNKQSEKDIWDSFSDWSLHRFVCLMKDNKICEFTGMWDESADGSRSMYLSDINDEYEIDDIVLWIEIP